MARPKERRLSTDEVLRGTVHEMLDQAWSSKLISHAAKARFPGIASRHLSHESIYQAIYARDGVLGKDRCLTLHTRRRRRAGNPGAIPAPRGACGE